MRQHCERKKNLGEVAHIYDLGSNVADLMPFLEGKQTHGVRPERVRARLSAIESNQLNCDALALRKN